MKDKDCLTVIKTDIATIKESLKGINKNVEGIMKDINGIYPKVNEHSENIAVLKNSVEGIEKNWKDKEIEYNKNIGFYKAFIGILASLDIVILTLIGVFLGVK